MTNEALMLELHGLIDKRLQYFSMLNLLDAIVENPNRGQITIDFRGKPGVMPDAQMIIHSNSEVFKDVIDAIRKVYTVADNENNSKIEEYIVTKIPDKQNS